MIRTFSFATHEIADFISWSYFFHAWGFPAKFSAVSKVYGCSSCLSSWTKSFDDERDIARASEAAKLYADALKLLADIDGVYNFSARVGIFDANSDGDDIIVYNNDGKCVVLPFLRQQYDHSEDGYCLCLADFIRPVSQGVRDKIGVFVSCNDGRMEHLYHDDDYMHMLCQTLSDRLAEAGTEMMHMLVRRDMWGYAKEEHLTPAEMAMGKFVGIRPAVGYPSMPDQSIIFLLDSLVDFSQIGVKLTESGAMNPHASVSGLMFAHPKSRYFSVGRIGTDQLDDYARRRGLPMDVVSKFLSANLVR